ncbi:MAG: hypothetical protein KF712_19655 [Akkermansiaceae bacterium]|nr:hypothetical protein [Akkermansiaceae bacterium]
MKRILFLAACCLSLPSCDKAKEIASKAQVAVEEVKADLTDRVNARDTEIAPDADLQPLVDHTAEGYLFRKDLPFPSHLTVRVVEKSRIKGRYFESSLLGSGGVPISGEFENRRELELRSGMISVTSRDRTFIPDNLPEGKDPEEAKKVVRKGAKKDFVRKDGKWTPSGTARDFSSMVAAGTDPGQGFSDDCIMPRPFWFGKKRLQSGDEVVLSGPHLAMVGFQGATGEIRLKFIGPEAVGGHPCGAFSLSGLVDSAGSGLLGDDVKEGRISISSGKLWFSLIHPVVLKEEWDAVITAKSGDGKSLSSQLQGSAAMRVEREWAPGFPSGPR